MRCRRINATGLWRGACRAGCPLRVTMADAHTLQAIGALPTDVISALLNVPDVSLRQWHVIRTGQRRVTAAPRRPPRALVPHAAVRACARAVGDSASGTCRPNGAVTCTQVAH